MIFSLTALSPVWYCLLILYWSLRGNWSWIQWCLLHKICKWHIPGWTTGVLIILADCFCIWFVFAVFFHSEERMLRVGQWSFLLFQKVVLKRLWRVLCTLLPAAFCSSLITVSNTNGSKWSWVDCPLCTTRLNICCSLLHRLSICFPAEKPVCIEVVYDVMLMREMRCREW